MSQQIESYPLAWPAGWPRAKARERARFKCTFEVARKELFRELALMGAPDYCVVLSTNLPLRRDGMPYSGMKPAGGDPGVAIYFQRGLEGKRYVFACDRWDRIEDNMRAIQHSIAAIRGIERWGASDMLERAFTGFTALPAPESPAEYRPWWVVLGVGPESSMDTIKGAYNVAARRFHPDLGGDPKKMAELNQAMEEARAAKGVA